MKTKEKTRKRFKASSLQKLLIILNVFIFILALAGFYFAQDWMRNATVNSSTRMESYNQSETNRLKNEIAKQKSNIIKAKSLTLDAETYQTKINQDLRVYARQSGLTIGSVAVTTAPSELNPANLLNGVTTKYLIVALNNPVGYNNLIRFIKLVETNSPKTQVVNLGIDSPSDAGENVYLKQLIIEVYVR